MASSLKKIFKSVYVFFRGGTSGFNDAENKILSYLLNALPLSEKEILQAQFQSLRLVQRPQPGRLVVAYYRDPENVVRLPYPGYEHCLAKVSYKSHGKTKTTAIVLHEGRLMTFERNVPRDLSEIESLVKIVFHPNKFSSVATEIDAEEHGEQSSCRHD